MQKLSSFWRYLTRPRSAFNQIFILISFLLLISQIIAYFPVYAYFIQPAHQQINSLIGRQVETLFADNTIEGDGEALVELINTHIAFDEMQAYSLIEAEERGLNLAQYSSRLSKQMSGYLGNSTEVRYREIKSEDTLYLWIRPPQAPQIWLKATIKNFDGDHLVSLTLYLLMIAGLSLLGGWVLARQQTSPLKNLEQATLNVSDGHYPEPLALRGSTEVIAVTKAFNLMSENMKRLEQDRNLLMAGISHDLRTPLTRIRLACEMLPIEDEHYRQEMILDIEDMNEIIDQFISYIQQDRRYQFQEANINDLVRHQATSHHHPDIKIDLNLQHCPAIYVSTTGIKRVLSNLIENAKRYGNGWVQISTSASEEGILLKVEDNGTGIPLEEIDNLCQPFTRGNSARTTQGSGLGLAIIKKIVTNHQGKLFFANRKQGGLSVEIFLPYQSCELSTDLNASASAPER